MQCRKNLRQAPARSAKRPRLRDGACALRRAQSNRWHFATKAPDAARWTPKCGGILTAKAGARSIPDLAVRGLRPGLRAGRPASSTGYLCRPRSPPLALRLPRLNFLERNGPFEFAPHLASFRD